MNHSEAKSGIKALYLQAASLAGLEVTSQSPEHLCSIVESKLDKIEEGRRPEAVANLLMLLSAALLAAQHDGSGIMGEDKIEAGRVSVCPVYPFD